MPVEVHIVKRSGDQPSMLEQNLLLVDYVEVQTGYRSTNGPSKSVAKFNACGIVDEVVTEEIPFMERSCSSCWRKIKK